jgi:hypothetical protein
MVRVMVVEGLVADGRIQPEAGELNSLCTV